jgi:hypothetical protein
VEGLFALADQLELLLAKARAQASEPVRSLADPLELRLAKVLE